MGFLRRLALQMRNFGSVVGKEILSKVTQIPSDT